MHGQPDRHADSRLVVGPGLLRDGDRLPEAQGRIRQGPELVLLGLRGEGNGVPGGPVRAGGTGRVDHQSLEPDSALPGHPPRRLPGLRLYRLSRVAAISLDDFHDRLARHAPLLDGDEPLSRDQAAEIIRLWNTASYYPVLADEPTVAA